MKYIDKLENYLEAYTREDYFQKRVKQIRKDIGIPASGIKFPGNSFYDSAEYRDMNFYIKYKDIKYPVFPAKRAKIYSELIEKILHPYKNKLEIIVFINIYILYNNRSYEIFDDHLKTTVALIKYRNEYLERAGCCNCEIKVCENYMDEISKEYPVIIGVSPYASQSEVIDLIKKKWNYIEGYMTQLNEVKDIDFSIQDKKKMLGIRKRSSKSKEIEDVVYENKEFSLESLTEVVKKETGEIVGEGEIGKIRSLAIKRRRKNGK